MNEKLNETVEKKINTNENGEDQKAVIKKKRIDMVISQTNMKKIEKYAAYTKTSSSAVVAFAFFSGYLKHIFHKNEFYDRWDKRQIYDPKRNRHGELKGKLKEEDDDTSMRLQVDISENIFNKLKTIKTELSKRNAKVIIKEFEFRTFFIRMFLDDMESVNHYHDIAYKPKTTIEKDMEELVSLTGINKTHLLNMISAKYLLLDIYNSIQ